MKNISIFLVRICFVFAILTLLLSQGVDGWHMIKLPLKLVKNKQGSDASMRKIRQYKWHIPTYQGITLGKSKKADVERIFGKPIWLGPPEEKLIPDKSENELWYEYENVGGVKGRTTVILGARSQIAKAILLYYEHITREQVINQYGSGYIKRERTLGPCPSYNEIRKHKPSQKKMYPFFLIYPRLGIYVTVQEDSTVSEIGYLMRCP